MEKAYETYKDSGVEWIGEIPESWDVTSIKNLLEIPITDGPHTTPKLYDTGIPFISAEAIRDNKIDFNRKRGYISEKDYELFSKKYVPKRHDIYMVKSGATTGNIGVVETDEKFTIWSPLAVFRTNNEKAFHRYLIYFLQSNIFKYQVELNWSYGTQQNIGMGVLSNLKITYPNTKVQTQIAAYLDYHTQLIDNLISKKETLIQKLQEQRQAIINEAVTKGLNKNVALKDSGIEWLGDIPEHWTIAKFKYFAKIRNGKDQKSVLVDDGKYPILGTGGEFGRSSEFLYDKPSVLLGRKGTIDKPQFIEEPFWTVDTLFYTEIESDVVPKFLFYLSTLIPFSLLQESSAVPSMTQDKLHNVFLTKPSYDEQLSIVAFLESELNKLNVLNQLNLKQIQKLKAYRQSLISEAVTGKIDVRDWQQPKNKS
ncbi:restriction endonuclease subunit S [Tenacibaculum maritimum]|uniref:restriction endonuclease subunit S n=1 Tax=Tenacibaculum maritimum TaxID=107401 RepID=UPI00388FCB6A